MASELHLVVVDPPHGAVAAAVAELERLESRWSRFLATSDISRLNLGAGRPVPVDPSTLVLLATMIEAWRSTAGGFDPTILPALVANGYAASRTDPDRRTVLPPAATARPSSCMPNGTVLMGIGPHGTLADVELDEVAGTAALPEGMAVDPGGIGKGLAADLVVRQLLAAGATGALVGIGGDLAMGGVPPLAWGWSVVIERPDPTAGDLATIGVSGGGVATSSVRSRRWSFDGVDRHHHIDPATGLPSTTDLDAVTVIAPTGWLAEAHAGAALARGSAGVLAYLDGHRLSGVAFPAGAGEPLATADLRAVVGRASADPADRVPARPANSGEERR